MAKAVGPDNIPNKLLKDFAQELAPIIREIYDWRKGTFRPLLSRPLILLFLFLKWPLPEPSKVISVRISYLYAG